MLLTGMSGTGKTTLLGELQKRGHLTVDTDYDGWTLPDGRWDEPRVAALLADERPIVVSGTVENQGRFYDRFDHVVLLSAPLHVRLKRVRTRTDNPFGGTQEQQQEITDYLETVEPLLRRTATVELDSTRSVQELADDVEQLMQSWPSPQPLPGQGRYGSVL